MTIFNKLPGEAYDASNDRLVKAHMIKVSNNEGLAKVCDIVDLMLAGKWQDIAKENLTVEGTDGPIDDFQFIYQVLDSLHTAGNTWEDIKKSVASEEEAWI